MSAPASRMSRRAFVNRSLGCAAAAPFFPAIIQSDVNRPTMPQGVASGDVSDGRAVVWSRTDRPARMLVEYSTTDKFENAWRRTGPAALESTDFTARIVLTDLPSNQRIFYRVTFQDLGDLRALSVPLAGSFQTPAPASVAGVTPFCPQDTSSGPVRGTITPDQVLAQDAQGIAAGEFDEVVRAIRAGAAYANVHSQTFTPGEIRGQIHDHDRHHHR